MKKSLYTLLVLSILLVSCRRQSATPPTKVPLLALSVANGRAYQDPCEGKKRCLLVFMAPWCPDCHKAIPLVQYLQKKLLSSQNVGLKIIVGNDSEQRLEELAKQVGGQIFLDREGTFHEAMSIEAVPTWIVVDGASNVIVRLGVGVSDGTLDELYRYFTRKLKLDEFI